MCLCLWKETLEGCKRGGSVGTDRRVGSSNVGERFVFSTVYIFIIILFFALMCTHHLLKNYAY